MALPLSKTDPELAGNLQSLTKCLKEVLELNWKGFYQARSYFLKEAGQKIGEIYRILGNLRKGISGNPSLKAPEIASVATILSHYQKIAFNLERINTYTRTKNKEGFLFTEKAVTELEEFFRGGSNLFTRLNEIIPTGDAVMVEHILKEGEKYERLAGEFSLEHEDRLIKGACLARSSSLYLHLLFTLEDIFWHLGSIVKELKSPPATFL